MTVARRMLLNVALGTTLVVAVLSAATYRQVFDKAEASALVQLETYATGRARRLDVEIRRVYENLETVRGLLLKRENEPIPDDIRARWDHFIVRDPDQGWRSRKDVTNPLYHATVWCHKDLALTPPTMNRILYTRGVTDDLMPVWSKSFPSVYVMFAGSACVGFNPLQPYWEWETPSDYPMEQQEWYRVGTPERNPSRDFAWTGVYVDDGSKIPFASVILPVEKAGETICMIGHDIDVAGLFDDLTRSTFGGASHIVFQADGRLIVHPGLREEIQAGNGRIMAQNGGGPALSAIYQKVTTNRDDSSPGYEPVGDVYVAQTFVPKANWYFVTTLPRALVREQALNSARWVLYSGLASVALLLATFAFILRREVGKPLAGLLRATRAMTAGDLSASASVARADDLGALANSFNRMVSRVAEREAELRQLNLDLERTVDERTSELNVALERERELGEMKSNFVSMASHEFRNPLGVILSATDVLDGYFDRLSPEKRARHLQMIRNSTLSLSALIDEVLLLGRTEDGRMEFHAVPVNLHNLCSAIVDEMYSATAGACTIQFQPCGSLDGAMSDESILRHILGNLLSNAVKYSERGSPVKFTAARDGSNVVFTIRDNGIGIPEQDLGRLFTFFTRGGNVGNRPGTGLGLVIVKRCVDMHGGSVALESLPGSGTVVTLRLPVFESNTPSQP